jgi:heterodisulfide reductase subunit C
VLTATQCRYVEDVNPAFPAEIMARPGGEDLQQCIQCGTCSAGCPLAIYMDYTPRRIIALTRSGLERDVLQSVTPWLCASCYECQVRCPRGLKVTDIMYALKRRAMEKKVYPKKFPIPVLANEFFKAVASHGRNSETWVVTQMLLRTRPTALLAMAPQGLKLLRAGRLSLKKDRIENTRQLKTLLDAVEAER